MKEAQSEVVRREQTIKVLHCETYVSEYDLGVLIRHKKCCMLLSQRLI